MIGHLDQEALVELEGAGKLAEDLPHAVLKQVCNGEHDRGWQLSTTFCQSVNTFYRQLCFVKSIYAIAEQKQFYLRMNTLQSI